MSIEPSLFLLVSIIAVYRVTRLLVVDRVFQVPREKVQDFFEIRWIEKHDLEDPDIYRSKVAYLLSCMWCMSIWVATVFYLVFWASTGLYPVWFIALCIPVASAVTGLIHSWENKE